MIAMGDSILLLAAGVLVLGLGAALFGLYRRLERIRVRLERLDELGSVAQRIEDIATEVEQREFATQLHSKLTEFTEAHRRLTTAVAGLQDLVRRGGAGTAAGAPEDAVGAARHHLAEMGFDHVRVLPELTEAEGRSGRVGFEARREGVEHKGHVRVVDGAVVEEKIQAVYSAFP